MFPRGRQIFGTSAHILSIWKIIFNAFSLQKTECFVVYFPESPGTPRRIVKNAPCPFGQRVLEFAEKRIPLIDKENWQEKGLQNADPYGLTLRCLCLLIPPLPAYSPR